MEIEKRKGDYTTTWNSIRFCIERYFLTLLSYLFEGNFHYQLGTNKWIKVKKYND